MSLWATIGGYSRDTAGISLCPRDLAKQFHPGSKSTRGKQNNSVEKGLGKRVVKDLTGDLKGKNHHVYFDNFFTSLDLIVDLEKDGIYSCGTARKDRKGFPPELKKPALSNR